MAHPLRSIATTMMTMGMGAMMATATMDTSVTKGTTATMDTSVTKTTMGTMDTKVTVKAVGTGAAKEIIGTKLIFPRPLRPPIAAATSSSSCRRLCIRAKGTTCR